VLSLFTYFNLFCAKWQAEIAHEGNFPRAKIKFSAGMFISRTKFRFLYIQKPELTLRLKALTKSTLCQTLKNLARQGSKLAGKGAYMDVSYRRRQVQLTLQAKIPSTFSFFEGIFAFAGLVNSLSRS